MSNTLDEILGIIRTVRDDSEKLECILDFLQTEIVKEEELFSTIDLPEKYLPAISEIAEFVSSDMVCFLNLDTLEIDSYTTLFLAEIDEDDPEKSLDIIEGICGVREIRFFNWKNKMEFHPLSSHDAYQIMETYAENASADPTFQEQLLNALSRGRPFANFKHIIHNSSHREEWFEFERKWVEQVVANQLKRESDELN